MKHYDGSTWTATPATLATARTALGSTRTSSNNSSAVSFCWVVILVELNLAVTEEYNFTANTVTAAAWASGGNLSTAREKMSGFGTQAAATIAGGYAPSHTNATEEYDGSSWTGGGNLIYCKDKVQVVVELQTAALAYGGYNGSSPYLADSEEYDGTNWSEQNNLNTAEIYYRISCGISNSSIRLLVELFLQVLI